jgi:hypothetical protein
MAPTVGICTVYNMQLSKNCNLNKLFSNNFKYFKYLHCFDADPSGRAV